MDDLSCGEGYMASARADARLVRFLLPRLAEHPEAACLHCAWTAEKQLRQMWLEEGFASDETLDLTDLLSVACERGWVRATKDEVAATAFLEAIAERCGLGCLGPNDADAAVACLVKVASMLDRNGYPSVSAGLPGQPQREVALSTDTAPRGAVLDPGSVTAGMEWDGHGRWRLTGPIARRRPEAPDSGSFAVTVLACGFVRGMSEREARKAAPFFVRLTAQDPLDPTNGVAFEGRADTFDAAIAWACDRAAPISSCSDALREGNVEEW